MTNFQFRLRTDLPRGFKSNDRYPELPAICKYLDKFAGTIYPNLDVFNAKVIVPFLEYLEEQKVPVGEDSLLRQGLQVKQQPYQGSGGSWDYEVSTPASNGPGVCVFGGLERIALQ